MQWEGVERKFCEGLRSSYLGISYTCELAESDRAPVRLGVLSADVSWSESVVA